MKKLRSPDAVISIILFAALAGHVLGFWQIPILNTQIPSPNTNTATHTFNPGAITVAFSTPHSGPVSPWPKDDVTRIISRFAAQWSEATLGRSHLVVLEESDLRNVLVVFSDKSVTPPAEARYIPYAGGRLRYIEVFAPSLSIFGPSVSVDVEYTAGTLLHELGHALGCCSGPGTAGGHFVGINCVRILCSPHGSAKTFSEEELAQMGLGR